MNYDKSIKILKNIYLDLGFSVRSSLKGSLELAPIHIDFRWKGDHVGTYLSSSFIFYHLYFEVYNNSHAN